MTCSVWLLGPVLCHGVVGTVSCLTGWCSFTASQNWEILLFSYLETVQKGGSLNSSSLPQTRGREVAILFIEHKWLYIIMCKLICAVIVYFTNMLFCTQNLHNEFTLLKRRDKLEKSCPHQKSKCAFPPSHQNKYALPPGLQQVSSWDNTSYVLLPCLLHLSLKVVLPSP